jgi:exoribonuclease-2
MFKNNDILLSLKKELKVEEKKVVGKVRFTQKNFGFLITENKESYFIPPNELKKVLPNDTVECIVRKNNDKEYVEVISLIEQEECQLIGKIEKRNNNFFFQHARFKLSMFVLPNPKMSDNDYVEVKLNRHPLKEGKLAVSLVSVICNESAPDLFWQLAMYENKIKEVEFSGELPEKVKENRELLEREYFAIDSKSTRDRDDVIYIEKTDYGYMLSVAISDVAEYIKEGSEIDLHAKNNKNSFYLLSKTLNMLPRKLSEDLLSLNKGFERLVVLVDMKFNEEGKCIGYDFKESKIKIAENYAYSELDLEYKNNNVFENKKLDTFKDFYELRKSYREKTEILMEYRIDYSYIVEDYKLVNIIRKEESLTDKMIAESMSIANVCCANLLTVNDSQGVFNGFAGYQKEKKPEIIAVLDALSIDFKEEDLFTFKTYQNIQQEFKNKSPSEKSLLNMFYSKSVYSAEPKEHYGLSVEAYATFTSPIRKYGDLENHRRIKSIINNEKITTPIEEDFLIELKDKQIAQRKSESFIKRSLGKEYFKKFVGKTFNVKVFNVLAKGVNVKYEDNDMVCYLPFKEECVYDPILKTLIHQDKTYKINDILNVSLVESGDRGNIVKEKNC